MQRIIYPSEWSADKQHFQKLVGNHEIYFFETAENGREGASAEILQKAEIA